MEDSGQCGISGTGCFNGVTAIAASGTVALTLLESVGCGLVRINDELPRGRRGADCVLPLIMLISRSPATAPTRGKVICGGGCMGCGDMQLTSL